jgi:hypothetical protein
LTVTAPTTTATMSTAAVLYIMLTIQGSVNSANGAWIMCNINKI